MTNLLQHFFDFSPQPPSLFTQTGFTFDKIADMAQTRLYPKVVRVCSAWKGSTPEASVELNSLLVMKGWKRRLSQKVMKAYDINTREKKELPENCTGMCFAINFVLSLFGGGGFGEERVN